MEDIKRKRTILWHDPEMNARDAGSISGLTYLQSIKNGSIKPPPIASLVGYSILLVENGHAIYEFTPEEYHCNPFGTVHGGIISTVLDTTMTAAVLSTLQKGKSCATAEIKINFTRPIAAKTGVLQCEARPIHMGKRLATAEGRLTDKNGNIHAHGVCTCSIFTKSR